MEGLTKGQHWHQQDRVKTCIICQKKLPLDHFYSYGYTTRQGKQSTRYESRCAICARARRKVSYHDNRDQNLAAQKKWRDTNRDHIAVYNAGRQSQPHHLANKAKSQRMRKARMRSGEKGQCPAVAAIYAEAMEVEAAISSCPVFDMPELGRKMHVDHIVALANGGMHVAENLQILPAGINLRKGVSPWAK